MSSNISRIRSEVLGVICICLVVLKLGGVINWSWWVVMFPFYIIPVLVFSFALILYTFFAIKHRNDATKMEEAIKKATNVIKRKFGKDKE